MIGTFKLPTGVGQCGAWQPHWGVDIRPLATENKVVLLLRDDKLSAFQVNQNYTVSVNGGAATNVNANTRFTFDPANYSNPYTVPWHDYGTYIVEVTSSVAGAGFGLGLPSGLPTSSFVYITGLLWCVVGTGFSAVGFSHGVTTNGRNLIRTPFFECIEDNSSAVGATSAFGLNYGLIKVTTQGRFPTYFTNLTALKELSYNSGATKDQEFIYMNDATLLENANISGVYPNVTLIQLARCISLNEDITFETPALYNFAGNTELNNIKSLLITKSNFRSASAPAVCFDISGASMLTETLLNSLVAGIGSWERTQGLAEGKTENQILIGKTFRFSRCLGSATFDATPLTNLGATVTR